MSQERSVKDVFGPYIKSSGGEGGIRTPGRGFGPYNGLANLPTFLIRSENIGLYYILLALTTRGI